MDADATSLPLAALHLYLQDLLTVDALRFRNCKWRHISLQIDTPTCPSPSATHFGGSSSNLLYALSDYLVVLSFTFADLGSRMASTGA